MTDTINTVDAIQALCGGVGFILGLTPLILVLLLVGLAVSERRRS